jgi:hypothetical protein
MQHEQLQKRALNKILDIDPELIDTPLPKVPAVRGELVSATDTESFEQDFTYARNVVRESIDQAREAAVSAIELAQSGDTSKAYEVVASMLTAIVNANKELLLLHKTKEDTRAKAREGTTGSGAGVTIEKAVFVGRASDLLRELRTLSKKQPDVIDTDWVKE